MICKDFMFRHAMPGLDWINAKNWVIIYIVEWECENVNLSNLLFTYTCSNVYILRNLKVAVLHETQGYSCVHVGVFHFGYKVWELEKVSQEGVNLDSNSESWKLCCLLLSNRDAYIVLLLYEFMHSVASCASKKK